MCVHNRRKKKQGVMWWRKISHVSPHEEGVLLLLLFVGEWGGEDCHRPVLSGLIQIHLARFYFFRISKSQ